MAELLAEGVLRCHAWKDPGVSTLRSPPARPIRRSSRDVLLSFPSRPSLIREPGMRRVGPAQEARGSGLAALSSHVCPGNWGPRLVRRDLSLVARTGGFKNMSRHFPNVPEGVCGKLRTLWADSSVSWKLTFMTCPTEICQDLLCSSQISLAVIS